MSMSAELVLTTLYKRHERLKKKLASQGWVKDAIEWHKACGAEGELSKAIKQIERKINKSREAYANSPGVLIDNFADMDD
jgi:hypothetical protein